MAHKPRVLTVPDGAFGVSSYTAYTPVCAGTTTTGNVQSISTLGSAGQAYTSAGAGSLGSFENPGGYTFFSSSQPSSASDSTTYYFAIGFSTNGTTINTPGSLRFYVPKSGTIKAAYGAFTCTAGTSETSTVSLVINGSTTVNLTTTLNLSSTNVPFSNTSINQAVSAGDYIWIQWTTPAWVTNPGSVSFSLTVYVQ